MIALTVLLLAAGGQPLTLPGPQVAAPPGVRSPRTGDLDGDGLAEVVAVDRDGDALLVTRAGAGGAPGAPLVVPTGPAPELVRLAHVDGDGALDALVAWTGGASGGLAVHLGDGLGGFGPPAHVPLSAVPAELLLADLDADGAVDALVVGGAPDDATALALLGDGAGGLGPEVASDLGAPVSAVDLGDLDGDAFPDLFAAAPQPGASTVRLLGGRGDGSFAPAGSLAVDDLPRSVAVGDLDGDGADDVTVVSVPSTFASGVLASYAGDGAGGFGPPVPVSTGLGAPSHALVDVDGDGRLDVAAEYAGGPGLLETQFVVHFGGAGGVPGPARTVALRPDSRGADWADLDGDGRRDLVYAQPGDAAWARPVGFLGVVTQAGPREFRSARLVRAGAFSGVVARAADVDGDGRDDVVAAGRTASFATHAVVVQRGDGAGGFLPPRRTPYAQRVAAGPQALFVADLGTDGRPDAVVFEGGVLLVFDGLPDASFAAPWTTALPGFLGVCDLDGDGRAEVLAGRVVAGGGYEVAVQRFTGAALADLSAVPVAAAPQLARAADVDGDGVLDLVLAVASPAALEVRRGAGGLAFDPPRSVAAPPALADLVACDLAGDGLPELVGSVAGRNGVAVWWNAGGGLAAPARHPVGQGAARLTAGDLDGDGREEVVVAHARGANLAVVGAGPGGSLGPARFFALPRLATSLDVFRRAPATRPAVLFATGGQPLALVFEAFGLLPSAPGPAR